MISNYVLLSDTTPPTMSSVKTITTTSIEIQFNDDIDALLSMLVPLTLP